MLNSSFVLLAVLQDEQARLLVKQASA